MRRRQKSEGAIYGETFVRNETGRYEGKVRLGWHVISDSIVIPQLLLSTT